MTWAGLVSAAVLGTGRAEVPVDERLAGLGEAAGPDGRDGQDEHARLLNYAAALSRARRAGFRPPDASGRAAPDPAEPDGRPEVSLAAEQRLAGLLAAGEHDLAAEWLGHLAGRRPPDALLPGLLTAAASRPGLRASLLPALGPLAGWLARFSEQWAWAARAGAGRLPADPAAAWQTGSIVERKELLAALRGTDPAAGRELVASTWAEDGFAERAAFIALLVAGLGPADEPLAEQALADRRGEVRQAAAGLLARLPGSRFSRQAAADAAAAVRVEQTALRRRLIVSLPPPGGAPRTGGTAAQPSAQAPEAGARRLRDLVAAAPAAMWAGHAGISPAGLLDLADRTDWPGPLRAGWTAAAIRDQDTAWLLALLDQAPGRGRRAGRPGEHELPLLAALPPGDRDEWLAAHAGHPVLWAALDQVPAPWPARLSDVARASIATLVRADPGYSPGPRAALRLAAMRLEPPEPPAVDLVSSRLAPAWQEMLNVLTVRAAIRRELAEEPRSQERQPWKPHQ